MLTLTGHLSFSMASTLNYWTIASIVVGIVTILPFIMGFFRKNQFDVKGKVRAALSPFQPRLTRRRQSS